MIIKMNINPFLHAHNNKMILNMNRTNDGDTAVVERLSLETYIHTIQKCFQSKQDRLCKLVKDE